MAFTRHDTSPDETVRTHSPAPQPTPRSRPPRRRQTGHLLPSRQVRRGGYPPPQPRLGGRTAQRQPAARLDWARMRRLSRGLSGESMVRLHDKGWTFPQDVAPISSLFSLLLGAGFLSLASTLLCRSFGAQFHIFLHLVMLCLARPALKFAIRGVLTCISMNS